MEDEYDDESIRVHVRVRPLNEQERARGDQSCIHVDQDGRTVRFVASQASGVRNSNNGPATNVRALAFDSAMAGSSQSRVFEEAQTIQMLHDALDGFAVTVFAYGQTGSGKTYTMTGPETLDFSEEAPPAAAEGPHGLIPRGVGALFDLIAVEQDSGRLPGGCSVRASYLELYNESFNDLLNPESTNLQLRTHPTQGAFVENLLQVDCESVNDAMMVFAEGTRNRKVGSHSLNKDSSRSHCMMTLHLDRRDRAGPGGRITFVDLAGSERLPDSQSKGDAAKETGHINRSLFALGNVISALADSRKRGGHIPYRDSKLTQLLKDSLGGSARTLMLACCSPSSHHLEETTNTLQFASRTKNIQNRPVVAAQESGVSVLQQMQQTIRALQVENASLRTKLAQPLQRPPPPQRPPAAAADAAPSAAATTAVKESRDQRAADVEAAGQPAATKPAKIGISALAAVSDAEGAALRKEVASLKTENQELKRSQSVLARENQQLKLKLERLEQVFADGDRRS